MVQLAAAPPIGRLSLPGEAERFAETKSPGRGEVVEGVNQGFSMVFLGFSFGICHGESRLFFWELEVLGFSMGFSMFFFFFSGGFQGCS